jgi:tetrahydromethanopterin S-methyltransferase subunit G
MSDQQDSLRDRSIGELVASLSQDLSTLIRQELDLAKAEMTQKGKKAGRGVGLLGGAGVAGLLALICLSLTAIVVLNAWMRDWLAALIVTLVWAGVAAFLGLRGRRELAEIDGPIPQETKETIKEDIEWAKNPKRSATR